jgi:hypothetical protein
MGKINGTRVLLGGLTGGLLINVSEYVLNEQVLKADWQAAMQSLNRPAETSGNQIALFVAMSFAIGIAITWLYASIRPRFGPGMKTAVIAGLFVWFVGYVLAFIPPIAFGFFTPTIITMGLVWGLVEVLIASVIGAKIYSE